MATWLAILSLRVCGETDSAHTETDAGWGAGVTTKAPDGVAPGGGGAGTTSCSGGTGGAGKIVIVPV